MFFGSSKIWSDKLKLSYNKAHRGTERTEIKAMSRRCRWHKERRRCSIQISDNFRVNALCINSLIKFGNKLRSSTHRRCLRVYQWFVLIILRTLRSSVWHLAKDLSLGGLLSLQNSEEPIFLLRTDKNGKVEKIVSAGLVDTELLTSILANTEERM